jgi:hypothetical protein
VTKVTRFKVRPEDLPRRKAGQSNSISNAPLERDQLCFELEDTVVLVLTGIFEPVVLPVFKEMQNTAWHIGPDRSGRSGYRLHVAEYISGCIDLSPQETTGHVALAGNFDLIAIVTIAKNPFVTRDIEEI